MVPVSERTGNDAVLHDRIMEKVKYDTRVAIPAEVVTFDRLKQTVTVQPLIREKIRDKRDGSISWVELPILVDVTVQYPQGGGCVLTFDIHPGDEVMLVFQDLSYDSWWAMGGIQNWIDRRRHDLSDAVAIPGLNSQPRKIENIAINAAELRTLDGLSKVRIEEGKATVSAPEVDITATTINLNAATALNITAGAIAIETGTLAIGATSITSDTGDITLPGGKFADHKHPGVTTGPGVSGKTVW